MGSRNRLQIVHWDINKNQNGRYSVSVIATVASELINPGTIISCELRIPGTGYVKIKNILYYPSRKYARLVK